MATDTTSPIRARRVRKDPVVAKIMSLLKSEFPDSFVDVSLSGIRDNIHILVMSRSFDNMTEKKKQQKLWAIIENSDLTEPEKARVSMIIPLSPDEFK